MIVAPIVARNVPRHHSRPARDELIVSFERAQDEYDGSTSMTVTLIMNNVVYILDDIDMLPSLSQKAHAALPDLAQNGLQMPLRILFVEDNDYVRDLTLALLETDDREVVACRSAEEALQKFRDKRFDVVVTDISLPRMSGVELAKRVLEIAPSTWLIIASGYQMPAGLDQLGPHVRIMTKPFESEQVNAILNEIRRGQTAR